MIDLEALNREHSIVGSVVGASVGGVRQVAVAGVADARTQAPMSRETVQSVGSVTKAMTAAMVARLVHAGSLDLDRTVRDVLPRFRLADRSASDAVTVRHLLTHTAGFDGDVWLDLGDGSVATERMYALLSRAAQLHEPGAGFSYNNAAYAVLGAMVEQLTGAPFEDALRALGPWSGATPTTHRGDLGDRSFATGHVRGGDGWVAIEHAEGPSWLAAAGSRTWATVDDLLTFGEWHLGRGCDRSLHDALVAMRAPQVDVPDPNNGGTMALGVFLDDRWGTPVVFHDGGVAGQSAYLRVLPERDTVLVVTATGGVPQTFHRAALRQLSEALLDARPPDAAQRHAIELNAARYVGTYEASSTRVVVAAADDGLTVDITWRYDGGEGVGTGPLPLGPVDDRVMLAPLDGRDYVVVFPEPWEPCDHLLAGLRRLNRVAPVVG